jgi:hypothetical protein
LENSENRLSSFAQPPKPPRPHQCDSKLVINKISTTGRLKHYRHETQFQRIKDLLVILKIDLQHFGTSSA